jgi:glutathione S-transferase
MLLIGMFDSPFVRRVAISMKLLGLSFEHANWSVGKDFERIREYNPLGRVPTLVLDDGEVLMESSVILDYLDELVGPERALLPGGGKQRRDALMLMAMAVGAAEKGVAQVYEGAFRPPEKRHQPWVERCKTQMAGALQELEKARAAQAPNSWLMGPRMSQTDITLACVFTFLTDATRLDVTPYPALQALVARCEAMPVFNEIKLSFFTPKS